MAAADVAALARLAAPRLRRIGLLSSTAGYVFAPTGATLVGPGGPCESAVITLATGLPRPVDASGDPCTLCISVGFGPNPSSQQDVKSALAAAGRGWVYVIWPVVGPSSGNDGADGGSGSSNYSSGDGSD